MGMAINNSNMKQIDSCFLLPQDLPFPLLQLIRQSPLTRGSIAFLHVSIVPNSSFQGLVKLFKGIQDRAKLILANSVRPIRNAAKHWGDVTYCTPSVPPAVNLLDLKITGFSDATSRCLRLEKFMQRPTIISTRIT